MRRFIRLHVHAAFVWLPLMTISASVAPMTTAAASGMGLLCGIAGMLFALNIERK